MDIRLLLTNPKKRERIESNAPDGVSAVSSTCTSSSATSEHTSAHVLSRLEQPANAYDDELPEDAVDECEDLEVTSRVSEVGLQ